MSDSVPTDRQALLERLLREKGVSRAPGVRTPITRRAEGEQALSFAQHRLWFLDQLDPGSSAYNVPMAMRLRGLLDVEVLRATLREVMRRHETLRTSFPAVGGRPSQVIAADFELPWEERDFSGLPEPEALQECRLLIAEETHRPFDLAHGPVVRFLLIRLAQDDHVLVQMQHHIVSDAWSVGVLNRELSSLYQAFARGEPSPLDELPIQYADFAVWQRNYLQADVLDRQVDFWHRQLEGATATELIADKQRPPSQTFTGAGVSFTVDEKVTTALRELPGSRGTTLAITLQAAFMTLLHRYTGRTDIVVGSPTANRTRKEIEDLIGFFVNSVVLRTDLSGDPTFREVLERARTTALAAYDHQDLPFEQVVEELQPERDPSRHPLFQIMFAVQNAPVGEVEFAGISIESFDVNFPVTRFDFECHVGESTRGLDVWINYASDLYERDTIERLGAHFVRLLRLVTELPDTPISELPLLAEDELKELEEVQGERTEYPADRTVGGLFAEQAAATPDAVALEFAGETLSYAELNGRANRLAHWLREQGVGPEVLVGVCIERSVEMVVAVLGTLKAGGAYVPLDPDYPASRLELMLADTSCPVLLTQSDLVDRFPAGDRITLCLDQAAELSDTSAEDPPAEGSARDAAYVMYTSGSTGRPKGTIIEHRSIVRLVRNTNYLTLGADEVFLQFAPMSFDAATLELWGPLLNGGRLVLCPPGKLSLAELGAFVEEHGVTVLWLTGAVFHQMVEHHLPRLKGVRQLLAGGEALSVPHVRRVLDQLREGHRLINGYGPTENTTFTCCHVMTRDSVIGSTVPIGVPIANTQVRILDENMQLVPVGVPGELHIGGDGLARGYLGQPELTAERFVPDPFGEAGSRLYKTGDVVRYLPDRTIEFLGRRDDQVKLRGFRIELGEVETALTSDALVREAVAMVREDSPGDRRLVAYVVPDWTAVENSGASESDTWEEQHQSDWQLMYEETYGASASGDDPTFNIVGWNSSFTGDAIPAAEMREWVDATVDRIRSFEPRRVLEIGAGTGLLVARLAPECERYMAADFSAVAVENLVAMRDQVPGLEHVEATQRLADDFDGLEPDSFDTVILNSVSQYLPSAEYLQRVVEGAVRVLSPGGRFFVGDVRNLATLSAFHTAVETFRAADGLAVEEWRERAEQARVQEDELCVHPSFFLTLPEVSSSVCHVEVLQKRGRTRNELTDFRYDAVVHVGDSPAAVRQDVDRLDWESEGFTLDSLASAIAEKSGPVVATNVPNARVSRAHRLLQLRRDPHGIDSVAELRRAVATERGVDPEDLWDLGEEMDRAVEVSLAGSGDTGRMDVFFAAPGQAAPRVAFPTEPSTEVRPEARDLATDPLRGRRTRALVPRLRKLLGDSLPAFMIPTAYVFIEALPLNPNGKVDRRALPEPAGRRQVEVPYEAPTTSVERVLVEIWQEVLRVDRVGRRDNFFDLGGHSLLATQVMSRVRDSLGKEVPLRLMFDAPTVAQLAESIQVAEGGSAGAGTADGPALVARTRRRVARKPRAVDDEKGLGSNDD